MVEEVVDVVNEKDEVLYQIAKREAHEKGLLHRTVIAELIDSSGNWTLVKQAADRQDPFTFVSPTGGHVEAGESEDEALKREVKEELGIEVVDFKLVNKFIFNRFVNNRQENHYFIVYEVYSDDTPVLNEESVEHKKYAPNELRNALKDSPDVFGESFYHVIENVYPEMLA